MAMNRLKTSVISALFAAGEDGLTEKDIISRLGLQKKSVK